MPLREYGPPDQSADRIPHRLGLGRQQRGGVPEMPENVLPTLQPLAWVEQFFKPNPTALFRATYQ